MKLFITKADAINDGLTHHGTMYGVPAWMRPVSGEGFMAVPKFYPFMLWCIFGDFCFNLASYFVSANNVLMTPIRVGNRIEE